MKGKHQGTSINDLNKSSLETYRNHIRNDNPSFPYKDLSNEQFCDKVGISKDGQLTIGGILMLGQRDVVQRHISNFWIDYLEIPGKSLADAQVRYTYRMQEQDNIFGLGNKLVVKLVTYLGNKLGNKFSAS